MLDPFPIPPLPWLSRAVQPFADYANLPTLPWHIHEVLISFGAYTFVNLYLAPIISRALFPVRYAKLTRERRLSWDVHVVSLFQSCTINVLALWVMFVDEERKNMDWEQRVWGYTGASGMIQGLATGYFLWDLAVTIRYIKLFGYGMLAHAISALSVFSFGFRPFVNFYACTFILYELSSPFLNFHWFFDKLDMTGSLAQLINGIILLCTFFGCRLVWGTYQSLRVYQDLWAAVHFSGTTSHPFPSNDTSLSTRSNNIMHYVTTLPASTPQQIPVYLALLYFSSNLVLNGLNFYWFNQMIQALRKRFEKPAGAGGKKTREGVSMTRTTGADGKTGIVVDVTEVRRRAKAAEEVEGEGEEDLPAVS